MKNYTNIALVASFFALWMDSYFSSEIQIILGFLLIFSFGILHGANDLLLLENINKKNVDKSWYKVLIYYVVVVLAGILLFFVVPQIALLLFIIISSHHFGEQEWQQLENKFPKLIVLPFEFLYGLLILLLLFHFHKIQVQDIIFKITNATIPYYAFDTALKIAAPLYLLMSLFIFWKSEGLRKKVLFELFFLLLFAILFNSSSLIWGFAIYFVLWHSIPSIIDQIKFLNGSFSINNFIIYCRNAGIYWFISIIGIAGIYFLFSEEELFNAVFFSFLAAITFPHTFVINKMFGGKEINHS